MKQKMDRFGWIITRNCLDIPEIKMLGQRGGETDLDIEQALDFDNNGQNAQGILFHMYDDDGNRYCSGRFSSFNADPDEFMIGAPLRQFGRGLGCTTIKYHAKSNWTIG